MLIFGFYNRVRQVAEMSEMFTVAVELTKMIYTPNSTTLHFPFYYQNVEIGK